MMPVSRGGGKPIRASLPDCPAHNESRTRDDSADPAQHLETL